jgi:hypothetical protein
MKAERKTCPMLKNAALGQQEIIQSATSHEHPA